MPPPPVLASVWRGPVCEARIRGHVVVVDGRGRTQSSLGDPEVITTLRSSVKPLQALPFVRQAAGQLQASDAEIAIACASHNGEDVHVATVRGLLRRAGVSEDALACGPHPPIDPGTARRLAASGQDPGRIHNNCSGKHAAMLATCVVAGWPLQGYELPDHPCQQAVTAGLGWALGLDLAQVPWGIDGCGLPTFGVPLTALARAFAVARSDPSFQRCQDAMGRNPFLVAGTARLDTAVLAAAGGKVTAKIGAAGVWAAAIRPDGPGVAIKLESGDGEAIAPVAIAVLRRLGVLADPLPTELATFARPAVRNWSQSVVGETRIEEAALVEL